MFLSPNTRGRENSFWPVVSDAGWLSVAEEDRNPKQLADICLTAKYQGPFELIFYCYYAFPTDYPEDIRRVFGGEYFSQFIEPEARDEFGKTIQETSVEAVVTFNKGIFNHVSKAQIGRFVERLMEGELIQSQINGVDITIPVFLTFPTGWRYHGQYRQFRKAGLDRIRADICAGPNPSEGQNTDESLQPAERSMQTERSHTMGDKRGKKDKDKAQKQKAAKQEQETRKKQEKQPKSTP